MNQYSGNFFGSQCREGLAMQRDDTRDRTLLFGQIRVADHPDSVTVRVRNLSTGGLMADFSEPVEMGASVEVEVRGVGRVCGEVAWTAAGRIGIAFERPINPLLARRIVQPSVQSTAPNAVKPIG